MSENKNVIDPSLAIVGDVKLHNGLVISSGIILLFVAFMSVLGWNDTILKFGNVVFNTGPTLLEIIIIYLLMSLKVVPTDMFAGTYFYGKALKRLSPGLHFVPFGLMQIDRKTRLIQEFQCPGDPEIVFKGDDNEPLPPEMVRPIRVVTRAPKSDETRILDTQMTLVVNFIVQYSISDVFDFLANFKTSSSFEMQVRDIGEVTVAEKASKLTPAGFIEKLSETNESMLLAVIGRVEQSGVHIISIRLISPDISHKVSKSLAGISIARAESEQMKIRSEGERIKLVKEGAGKAKATLSILTAEAEGREKMKDSLGVSGEAVLASETIAGLSEKTDVLIAGAEGGMKDIMSIVKGAQSAITSNANGGTK